VEAGSWAALLEAAQKEILVVTHRFDPGRFGDEPGGPVTVRFSGRRLEVGGTAREGDRFVHEEVVEGVGSADGPVAVTARISGLNPGSWEVDAKAMAGRRVQDAPPVGRWVPWRGPSEGRDRTVTTCLKPFAKVPGLVRFGWLAMAIVGMVVGVAVQALVVADLGVPAGSVWPIALLGLVAGMAGAKVWFVVKHRGEHRIEGWCVQGFVTGFVVATLAALAALGVSIPLFFDAAAPGLFLGLAIGRLGCVVGGCCYGRPTTSRLGVWSSDQRVIRKRIPTQLIEAALLVAIGVGALVAALVAGAQGGGIFLSPPRPSTSSSGNPSSPCVANRPAGPGWRRPSPGSPPPPWWRMSPAWRWRAWREPPRLACALSGRCRHQATAARPEQLRSRLGAPEHPGVGSSPL
jgi:phosphatidylglycerol:prolipoprotein diacylglycerol transferase